MDCRVQQDCVRCPACPACGAPDVLYWRSERHGASLRTYVATKGSNSTLNALQCIYVSPADCGGKTQHKLKLLYASRLALCALTGAFGAAAEEDPSVRRLSGRSQRANGEIEAGFGCDGACSAAAGSGQLGLWPEITGDAENDSSDESSDIRVILVSAMFLSDG